MFGPDRCLEANRSVNPFFNPRDLFSYHKEGESGVEGNNVVTVLMKTQNIDIQAACDFV